MFKGAKRESFRKAVAAWLQVSDWHSKLREAQNDLASRLMGQQVELTPAKVQFGWWKHFLNGDVTVYAGWLGKTIAIDGCWAADHAEKGKDLTLSQYILDRLAMAEGCRTANYCINRYGLWSGMNDVEFVTADYVGDWFRHKAMISLGLPSLLLQKRTRGIDPLACVKDPLRAYYEFIRNGSTA